MPLVEVDHAAFQVQASRGVLAHAVESFAVGGRQMQFDLVEAIADFLEGAGSRVVRRYDIVEFAEDGDPFLALMPEEAQMRFLRFDFPILDDYPSIVDGDRR
jgi:hypothetical protein